MKKTDNNHKIYINAKGKPVMRVTEVISYLSKEGLETWLTHSVSNILIIKKNSPVLLTLVQWFTQSLRTSLPRIC